ncbi:MAG: RelA/SpoT family protein, partial [Erysipelotrichaceae bacterium]
MNTNNTISIDILLDKVSNYIIDSEDIALIKKAYNYALDIRGCEVRKTGEPYINHLLNVAYILAEIKADPEAISAGLLHDVLEDNRSSKEQLITLFGEEVTNLVLGITVINKLNFTGDKQSIIANHRKILVGLSEDVRVIFIKLADRLHNMRTLWGLDEKAQKEKAKETLDILIPIAHRLGMNNIKGELEDLCLRYSKPDIYFDIIEQLNQTKNEREELVNQMLDNVSKLLTENNIKYEIKGRAKSVYSIYKKLDKGKSFNSIYDIYALRVFVDKTEDCYQVLGIIHSKYRPMPKRFKDYIAMPKTNMYQSLHTTIFGIDEHLFEIQIRTYEMDAIAENGIASHWSFKEKGSTIKASLQNAMEQKLQFFKSIMELKDEMTDDEDFVNSVTNEVLNNNIYVFTPNGDVIELSKGSTPIDFAYRVHSSVGDHMIGSIVNDNIVPLDYVLHNNDIVKINTNKQSAGPSKEWINIA